MDIVTVVFIFTLCISKFAWSTVNVPRKDWRNTKNYKHLNKLHKRLTEANQNRSANETFDILSKYGNSNYLYRK